MKTELVPGYLAKMILEVGAHAESAVCCIKVKDGLSDEVTEEIVKSCTEAFMKITGIKEGDVLMTWAHARRYMLERFQFCIALMNQE